MIYGIGLDVVDIARIQSAVEKSDRFVSRVLTTDEIAVYRTLTNKRQLEFLAGRFAAKEAFSKAFGTGIGALSFLDISILPNDKNKPIATCTKFDGNIFVSITHTETIAVAQVVLEV